MRGSLLERSVVTESHGREQYEGVGRGWLSVQRHDDQATQQENVGVTSKQSCRQARLCFSSYILRSRRSYLWAFGTSFAFKRALGSPTSQVLNTSSMMPRRTIAQSCSTRPCMFLHQTTRVGTRRSGCLGTGSESCGGVF